MMMDTYIVAVAKQILPILLSQILNVCGDHLLRFHYFSLKFVPVFTLEVVIRQLLGFASAVWKLLKVAG